MQVVSRKDFEILVHMGELLKVVNIVFVGFKVKTQIHSGKFIELSHIRVVAEVVTTKMSLFLAMLLNSLQ